MIKDFLRDFDFGRIPLFSKKKIRDEGEFDPDFRTFAFKSL